MHQLGFIIACNFNVYCLYSYSDKHTVEIAIVIDNIVLSNL